MKKIALIAIALTGALAGLFYEKDAAKYSDKIDHLIGSYVDIGNFSGAVLVAKNGNTILEKSYGNVNYELNVLNNNCMKFRIGSISKIFTGHAIAQLQQRGSLKLENTLNLYFPDYPNGSKITLSHLVNHTSGIENYTSFVEYRKLKKVGLKSQEIINLFKNKDLLFEPGTKRRYSNSNYFLLSLIIEKISGLSYEGYLQKNIFDMLEMKNTGIDSFREILSNRASGYNVNKEKGILINADFIDTSIAQGAGNLYSTIQDMYTFVHSFYPDITKAIFTSYQTSSLLDANLYGWGVDSFWGKKALVRDGQIDGFHGVVYQFEENDVCIIILSNFKFSAVEPIGQKIVAILFDQSYEAPKKKNAIALNSLLYNSYIGTYHKGNASVDIEKENDQLFLKTKRYKILLHADSETTFFVPREDTQVVFEKNEIDDSVTLLLYRDGNKELFKQG